ncbi:MAG: methyltransferase domain-containing protein [Desulfobacterales bacterium]|nr:methyltransferase domain-containing protein [Desulfobacterales bacterium]
MDLGSGDGITVITAAKRGARAIGIEYNPDMVELSKANAEKAGVVRQGDLHEGRPVRDGPQPGDRHHDVPAAADQHEAAAEDPGSRSPARASSPTRSRWRTGWPTRRRRSRRAARRWCTALFWIVPAKVEGRWQTEGGELTFVQTFQQVSGTLQKNGTSAAITDGRLRGAELSMTIDGAQYAGRVNGNTIEGTVTTGGQDRPLEGDARGRSDRPNLRALHRPAASANSLQRDLRRRRGATAPTSPRSSRSRPARRTRSRP